ncbi:MAG: adenosylmethionine decarboxylase [Bacillota bacterium]|nr:adenosylmethionine decarboxylase [Bacillota bacterium]
MTNLNSLGRHILAEIYGCTFEILNDLEKIQQLMVDAALAAGAEIRECVFHKFSPQGVSGVVVISESHLAIHTWPELGYAAVDVFTCGEKVDPWNACRYLVEKFQAEHMTATEIRRGIMDTSQRAAVNL